MQSATWDGKHQLSQISKPVVIADTGLLSKENIAGLKEKGYHFILGAKPKNEADYPKNQITDLELEDEQTAEFARIRVSHRTKQEKWEKIRN